MAVSRPVLLALIGAVLVAVLFFATMGSRQGTTEPPPVDPPTAEKAPKAKAAKKDDSEAKAKDAAAARAANEPKADVVPKTASPAGLPADVARVLDKKRTVVLFFHQGGSADDDATGKAVASLRGTRGVSVFSAPLSRLADYRAITGDAGVSRAPAVVVVDPQGRARLIEGFIDRETLAQEIADSR